MQVPISQVIPSYPGHPPPDFNRQISFVATLELPDLTQLTNGPIAHFSWWPIIPTKLPYDIPNFNGNPGEYPSTHVMMYHLWCSSNFLNYDSIQLCLFLQALIDIATKWYIEVPRAWFHDFNTLSTTFLTHLQFPIRYESGMELLTNFKQSYSSHISDHVHEWRRCRLFVKNFVLDQLLAQWFVKSLLAPIT